MAGANAIFTGETMLTTPCSGWDEDKAMLDRWGLRGLRSFEDQEGLELTSEGTHIHPSTSTPMTSITGPAAAI